MEETTMNNKQAEKRRDELLARMRELKGEAAAARTRFMMLLVEVGKDPEKIWAAGDDVITYEQFLVEHDICSRKTYERFRDGFEKLARASKASATSTDKLAQEVGHEAISRLPKIKTGKNLDRFIAKAVEHRNTYGLAPSAQRLDALLREIQPVSKSIENESPDTDVKKLRAKLEYAEAEVVRLKDRQQQLEVENTRLLRELEKLREQVGGRRARKTAA
jgi:hypothetical protein